MKHLFLYAILIACLNLHTTSLVIQESFQDKYGTNQTIELKGVLLGDQLGYSVSGAGDVNGDGYGDVIISANAAKPLLRLNAGTVYILFGSKNGITNVDLANLSPSQGFKIFGANINSYLGNSVKGAGDVNGDGVDDIIIGDSSAGPNNRTNAGAAYIIFGKKQGLSNVDLKDLIPTQGIQIMGAHPGDATGCSVSGAGDVNGDGIDDLIIGAHEAPPSPIRHAGITYVIFGTSKGFSNDIDLNNLTTSQGFRLLGKGGDNLGFSVSGGGDINGDGIDDIIVGGQGTVYVIFGSRNDFNDINLYNLTPAQGAKIMDATYGDAFGFSVSGAGDVNGDGINDIIVGAKGFSSDSGALCGAAYVIFGNKTGFSDLDIHNLANSQGFRIVGAVENDQLGTAVSGAGDVNNDGVDDIIIGAPTASPFDYDIAGAAYVIWGSKEGLSDINLANLTPSQGVEILGEKERDMLGSSVSGAGDIDGDGVGDILIGAPGFQLSSSGKVYIVMFE